MQCERQTPPQKLPLIVGANASTSLLWRPQATRQRKHSFPHIRTMTPAATESPDGTPSLRATSSRKGGRRKGSPPPPAAPLCDKYHATVIHLLCTPVMAGEMTLSDGPRASGGLFQKTTPGEDPPLRQGAKTLGGMQTAYDAEIAAIKAILKWYATSEAHGWQHMVIHSDSTSAIARATHSGAGPGQAVAHAIRDVIQELLSHGKTADLFIYCFSFLIKSVHPQGICRPAIHARR